ncbi:MAG: hypothetical protein J3R72DRAFT_448198 [Linnemannia gamsii]|nr:MAG: hypothetical protein J3R72DRAFT_448198 [Linnemannia gamsii]
MVKITFSLLSIAAVVASVVSASSCGQDKFRGFDSKYHGDNECIVEGTVKEYQTFQIKSYSLNSIVSKASDDDIVVSGVPGNKMFQELELCIVSTDAECNPPYPTNCVYDNVEYRFRVNGPVKGYLRVDGNEVIIVPNFSDASGLNLQIISSNAALRIGYKDYDGNTQVFSTPTAGAPIVIEDPVSNKYSQWMVIQTTPAYRGRRFNRFNRW